MTLIENTPSFIEKKIVKQTFNSEESTYKWK